MDDGGRVSMTAEEFLAQYTEGEYRTVTWIESVTEDKGKTLTKSGVISDFNNDMIDSSRPSFAIDLYSDDEALVFLDEVVSID